jgi:hypothetical protein
MPPVSHDPAAVRAAMMLRTTSSLIDMDHPSMVISL